MTTLTKLTIFVILAGLTIWYLSTRINSYDLRFYSGKDNGYFVRLESICFFSAIFWALMTDNSRAKYFFAGSVIGLLSALIAYLSLLGFQENSRTQVIFHVLAFVLFMATFLIVKQWRTTKNNYS
jgi:hypothetical protein